MNNKTSLILCASIVMLGLPFIACEDVRAIPVTEVVVDISSAYISEVDSILHEHYGDYFDYTKGIFIKTYTGVITKHVYGLLSTDIVVTVEVTSDGSYTVSEPVNSINPNYSVVEFKSKVDKTLVYEYILDNLPKTVYSYDSGVLTDLSSGNKYVLKELL